MLRNCTARRTASSFFLRACEVAIKIFELFLNSRKLWLTAGRWSAIKRRFRRRRSQPYQDGHVSAPAVVPWQGGRPDAGVGRARVSCGRREEDGPSFVSGRVGSDINQQRQPVKLSVVGWATFRSITQYRRQISPIESRVKELELTKGAIYSATSKLEELRYISILLRV